MSLLGVTTVEAVLLKGRNKVVSARGLPVVKRRIDAGEPPLDGTKLRVFRVHEMPEGLEGDRGGTGLYGDIYISRLQTLSSQRDTLLHELVHRYFVPRTGMFRKLRTEVRMEGFERSDILLYIEEALAEGYAQLKRHGLIDAVKSMAFPLGEGEKAYVTVSRLKYEGQVIGSVWLAGETFLVSFVYGR